MTRDAFPGRALEYRIHMAGLAGHDAVLARQLESGRKVIKDGRRRGRLRQSRQRQQQGRKDSDQRLR